MKGQTNAIERAVTVKTGVTVNMMQNIPEDVPWDLEYDVTLIHGIGPVTIDYKPITGARYFSGTVMNVFYQIRSYSTKLSLRYTKITGNSSPTVNEFRDITESELATAKLYLYGGGGA